MRIGECLTFGWDIFKRQVSGLVAAVFCLAVAQLVLHGVLTWVLRSQVAVVGSMLLSGLTAGGMMNVARVAARGQSPTLQDAFLPYRTRQGDYLLVGLASNIGALACGVGVVVSSFIFVFAPLLVVDGDDYKQALTRSKDLTFGHVGDVLVFFLVLGLINLIGFATVIGALATLPISALALLKAYEQVSVVKIFPEVHNDSPV